MIYHGSNTWLTKDTLFAGGGCENSLELLPVLTSRHLSYKTRVYSSCLRSAMHHASETFTTDLDKLAVLAAQW